MKTQNIRVIAVGVVGLLLLLAGCIHDPSLLSGTTSPGFTSNGTLPQTTWQVTPTAGYAEAYFIRVFAARYPHTRLPHLGGGVICSEWPVTSFSYSVSAEEPGLQAVIAINPNGAGKLVYADLNAPDTIENLQRSLFEMSCLTPGITSCEKRFRTDLTLEPQEMCIVLKNEHNRWIEATINVNWVYTAQDPSQLGGTGSVITVPPRGGAGICSDGPVTSFSYSVTALLPGLQAVLATNKSAFDALKDADLNDPSTAALPAPLLDMSCTTPGTTSCEKQFPTDRTLKAQEMCILLKNGTIQEMFTKVDVNWIYAPQ
jgi:hypothetical protein